MDGLHLQRLEEDVKDTSANPVISSGRFTAVYDPSRICAATRTAARVKQVSIHAVHPINASLSPLNSPVNSFLPLLLPVSLSRAIGISVVRGAC